MKRKLVEQGKTTLMISLPISWIRRYHLKKGSEIELNEEKGKIVITPGEPEKRAISVKIIGLRKTMKPFVAALYKVGYDKLELEYAAPEEIKEIQNLLGFTCSGYEIMGQNANKILIKNLMKNDAKEFNHILKRAFFFLISNIKNCIEGIEKLDKNILTGVVLRHQSINKYADICRRYVNTNPIELKVGPFYFILEALEDISYTTKGLADYCLKKLKKVDNKTKTIFIQTKKLLEEFYKLFYSKNFTPIVNEEHFTKVLQLLVKIKKTERVCPKYDSEILIWINDIVASIRAVNGALMAIKLDEIGRKTN